MRRNKSGNAVAEASDMLHGLATGELSLSAAQMKRELQQLEKQNAQRREKQNGQREEAEMHFLVGRLNEVDDEELRNAVAALKVATLCITELTRNNKVRRFVVKSKHSFVKPRYIDFDEETIVGFWLAGRLENIRPCAKCRTKWFIATRTDQQFCSAKCREASHWGTDAAKESARLRMQRYRKRLKDIQAARAKKVARSK